ncbi:MAG TPA: sulfotransferase [Rickettsiales bacterium]|nr:sulfotransferase [Rickettsiales bacterium]
MTSLQAQAEEFFNAGRNAAAEAHTLPLAETLIAKAIECDGSVPAYYQLQCDILRCIKQFDKAIAAGEQAVNLARQDAEAWYLLALACSEAGRHGDAAAHYQQALCFNPRHDKAANNLGAMLEVDGKLSEAEACYARAVESNPCNAEAQNNLGAILSTRGDLDRARQCFIASVNVNPLFVHAHYNLSTLKKYTVDDPHLIALEKLAANAHNLPVDVQLRLWFSLGKAWEDVKRYDDSFAAYERGNRIHRAMIGYDEKTAAKSTRDIIERFNKTLARKKHSGLADETPIFIVGMPRSGTTLIEQILSSHSVVFGAGELHDLCSTITQQWGIGAGISYIDCLQSATEEELHAIGAAYLQKIRVLHSTAPRITDKMPGNYFYIGLIHTVFPKAKIIHSMRDPMDTCFSNYSRLFKETMPFAYDLQELGRYWRQYDALMRHWKNVLPKGTILDVRYEDVVADLEGQARRLLDYCGLPWEEGCLAFYQNKRLVKTASVAQVRQPIYQSSVARWEHYRKHLEPLRQAMDGKEMPQQSMTIEQALASANQALERNQLAEAEMLLRKILEVRPREAQALHLLGLVAYKAGKPDIAIELVRQAIQSDGNIALFHANLTEMYRVRGELARAIAHGKQAIALEPGLIAAHANLGISYFDQKEYDKAEACQKAALAINPHFPPALNAMGSIRRTYKDDEGAMEYYRKAIAANPHYTEPLSNLSEVLVRRGQVQEALTYLDQVLAFNPNDTHALCNRGYALLALSEPEEAHRCFSRVLELRSDYAEAYAGLARLCNDLHQYAQAKAYVLKSLALKPGTAEFHSTLASIHLALGETDKALAIFETALMHDPALASAKLGVGSIMMQKGELAKAESIFRSVLDSGQERINALCSLSQVRKIRSDEDVIPLLEKEAEQLALLPDEKASRIHFALGKAYDDNDNPEKAFHHFLEGCRLHRKHNHYNAQEQYRLFARQKDIFSRRFIDQNRGQGVSSDVPIFVLGMPRSGTTLVEQIIASHPHVFGAGELPDFSEIAQQPQSIEAIGSQYVDRLRALAPGAKYITDKMPHNYFHMGAIHLALPNAKIIHVERHPLDTCLSCFIRLFSHPQEYTYNLYDLGRYYREYSQLMDHWRAVLPADSFYTIRYEELVADMETHARKLISYCGLSWDDACFEPHKTRRDIRTASVTQVRQPVYTSSVARWKKYERFLGPLIEGLGNVLKE